MIKNEIVLKNKYYNSSLSIERLISEYAVIAFSNISDIFRIGNNCCEIREDLNRDKLRSVQAIEIKQDTKGFDIKVKMYDKLNALKFLSHYLDLQKGFNNFDNLNRVILNLDPQQLDQLIITMEKHLHRSAP